MNREENSDAEPRERATSQIPVHIALLAAQVLGALYYVISRVALVGGMNRIVLCFYRDIVALLILVPAAYFLERGNRIKLSTTTVLRLILLGTFGVYANNYLLIVGIEYTSAEFSSAMQSLGPSFVALIAVIFGFDEIFWHRRDGQAKALGIVVSCAGGILMMFFKGPAVLPWKPKHEAIPWSPVNEFSHDLPVHGSLRLDIHDLGLTVWQFGALCLVGASLCMALYLNLQAPLLRMYPAPVSITAYSHAVGALLMGLTGAYAVRDPSAWTLSWNVNLVAVIYTGVVSSAVIFSLISWGLSRAGPLFISCYLPLQPAIATVLALLVIGTTVYLGSVIGTVMILIGLALVTWAHEERNRLSLLSRFIYQKRYSQNSFIGLSREPLIEVRHTGRRSG